MADNWKYVIPGTEQPADSAVMLNPALIPPAKPKQPISAGTMYSAPGAETELLAREALKRNKMLTPAGGLSLTGEGLPLVQEKPKDQKPVIPAGIGVSAGAPVSFTPINFDYQALKDQLADIVVPTVAKYRDPNFLDLIQAALAGFSGHEASYGKQKAAFDEQQRADQLRAIQQNQWNRQYNLTAENQNYQNALARAQLASEQNKAAADVALQNRAAALDAAKASASAKLEQQRIDAEKESSLSNLFSEAYK